MPLEVRELNIKVSVGNDPASAPPAEGETAGSPEQIREIVEKVLEALDKRQER